MLYLPPRKFGLSHVHYMHTSGTLFEQNGRKNPSFWGIMEHFSIWSIWGHNNFFLLIFVLESVFMSFKTHKSWRMNVFYAKAPDMHDEEIKSFYLMDGGNCKYSTGWNFLYLLIITHYFEDEQTILPIRTSERKNEEKKMNRFSLGQNHFPR